MKNELQECEKFEAKALEVLVSETLMQLETAKKTVDTLRSDACAKATKAYDALALELDQSRARVNFLEDLVSKLEAEKLEVAEIRLKENEIMLKLEIEEIKKCMTRDLEEAKVAQREAVMKTGRVMEQLEAAQAENAELEADLRRLKVQCDQWRKAAEVAASIISTRNNYNGGVVERTGSMDRIYGPVMRRMVEPYADDLDDDLLKKKNPNVLTRFGVLWKKPHK